MVGTQIDFDTLLALCRDEHRRIVLGTLLDERRALTMRDLSEAIVEYNHHTPLQEVSGETMTRIRIELHHVHVPKLVAAGLVEYDDDRELVEPTADFQSAAARLTKILRANPEFEAPLDA